MILDLERFLGTERAYWSELETMLAALDRDPMRRLSLGETRRLHYLYERASADLVELAAFAFEPEMRAHLDALVARAYAELHAPPRGRARARAGVGRALRAFPIAFRRRRSAFRLAAAAVLAGALFGAAAVLFDPGARAVLMPFPHLHQHPSERVRAEEAAETPGPAGMEMTFSAHLMTHNIRVSVLAMGLGMTFGLGTLWLLFYNGIILGAVCADYVAAGETVFLLGWLLPHGAIEIPAILIAGQAGLLLGGALLPRGRRAPLRQRLREVRPDLLTLIAGVSALLVWAAIVEAFLSQRHAPVVPYGWKIAFGLAQGLALFLYLERTGRGRGRRETPDG